MKLQKPALDDILKLVFAVQQEKTAKGKKELVLKSVLLYLLNELSDDDDDEVAPK